MLESKVGCKYDPIQLLEKTVLELTEENDESYSNFLQEIVAILQEKRIPMNVNGEALKGCSKELNHFYFKIDGFDYYFLFIYFMNISTFVDRNTNI